MSNKINLDEFILKHYINEDGEDDEDGNRESD